VTVSNDASDLKAATGAQGATGAKLSALFAGTMGPLIGLALLCLALTLTTDTFLTVRNILNVLDQITVLGIMAIGMTLVILIGGIDLSVGSVLALASMVMGFVAHPDYLNLGIPAGVVAALVAGFGLAADHFLSIATARALASQLPTGIILATGVTLVLVAVGIDLSVGSVLGLCGAVLAQAIVAWEWPVSLAIVACVTTGLACGLLNGLVTVAWSVPSFIVTLGTLEMARAACFLVTGSRTLYVGAPIEPIAAASPGGVPLAFALALGIVAATDLLLRRTVFGRRIVAVGDNPRAAWAAGVDPRPVRAAAFALSGALAGVAAVLHTSRLASADPNAGTGFELLAIAAVVVGGTSLMGGQGSASGSLLGALVIGVLATGLAQMGAQEPTKRLVTGAVIVAAVAVDARRRLADRSGRNP